MANNIPTDRVTDRVTDKVTDRYNSTRECFFGLNENDLEDEINLLNVCTPVEFYAMIRNQPLKYLSMIEHHHRFASLASKFQLVVSRCHDNDNLVITYCLPEDVAQHIISYNERVCDLDVIKSFHMHLVANHRSSIPIISKSSASGRVRQIRQYINQQPVQVQVPVQVPVEVPVQVHQQPTILDWTSELRLIHDKLDLVLHQIQDLRHSNKTS